MRALLMLIQPSWHVEHQINLKLFNAAITYLADIGLMVHVGVSVDQLTQGDPLLMQGEWPCHCIQKDEHLYDTKQHTQHTLVVA